MDPNEILKAAPEIAKGATAVAAAVPFTAIVRRMLGPAADEVAEMWRDQVRVYRYGRQLKLLEKAERMAEEAGFTPQAVPPKILFPLLEGASLEDDDDLHTMWAVLLANAASNKAYIVRPTFITLLRELAPDEAALLDSIWVVYEAIEEKKRHPWIHDSDMRTRVRDELNRSINVVRANFRKLAFEDEKETDVRYEECLQSLQRAGLIQSYRPLKHAFTLTRLGAAFLIACRPPKPKP